MVSVMLSTPYVSAERGDGERQPVQVVVQVEVTREAGPGVVGLVPGAVRALGASQPADAALDGRAVALARGEQREQRPRGLRGGGGALRRPVFWVVVRAQVLAPAAVRVLYRLKPGDRTADLRLMRLDPGGDQRGQHRPGAVQVVRAPPAEPRAVRLLVLQQPGHAAPARGLGGQPFGSERLHDVRGDVGARRVDDRAEVAERQLVNQLTGVVRVEGAPAAVLALHALEPAQAAPDRRAVAITALAQVDAAQREYDLGGVVGVGVVVVFELERPAARRGVRAAHLHTAPGGWAR